MQPAAGAARRRPTTAVAAAVLGAATLAGLGILAGTAPGVPLPWLQPAAESACIVAAGATAYLCLERHRARRAPLAWWIGLVLLAAVVFNAGYVLTFPGLIESGAIVGASPSTALYFFAAQYALIGAGCALAAAGARRRLAPDTPAGRRATLAATLLGALLVSVALVWLGDTGRFPAGAGPRWLARLGVAALLLAGVLLAPLTGRRRPWLSRPLLLCLALLAATGLALEFPLERYDAGWYVLRVARPLAFGLLLAALLAEYAALFGDERRRADIQAGLAAAAGELAALRTPEEIVRALGQRLRALAAGDRGVAVFLLDRAGPGPGAVARLRPAFAEGAVATATMAVGAQPADEGLMAHVLRTARPYSTTDVEASPATLLPGAPGRPGALLAVPVLGRHPLGVAVLTRRERVPYDELQIEAALLFAQQAAAALERAYQGQSADRMKNEFVSLVSHELRTPLTSIKGYVDLLLEGEVGEVTPAQRELLEIVKRNADREVALVNDLLDLSLLEAGRLDLRFSHIHLGAAVAAVCDAVQPQLAARGLTLTRRVEPDLPPVWADSNRIAQVLTALLSNAGKYTPPGGRVEVRAAATGSGVRVDVRDSGIGLTADELAQLFTRFFRGRNPEAAAGGGSGLGLAISRQLIELHGGALTVASTPGEGATFSVFLPLAPPAAPQQSAAGDAVSAAGPASR